MENTVNQPVAPVPGKKEPLLAAIGSFIFPGLGQVYNGEGFLKGLLYLFGTIIGSVIFVIPGLIVWLYGIYNAYKVADKMKSGIIPTKGTTTANIIIFIVLSIIIDVVLAAIIFILLAIIMVFVYGISNSVTSTY